MFFAVFLKRMKIKVSQDILLAMYKSVERMDKHYLNKNFMGVVAEKGLQENLRKDFEEVSKQGGTC